LNVNKFKLNTTNGNAFIELIDNRISLCVTVVKEPPYQVAETGYGGFTMPIDVYVKNNSEPKKMRFQYELFLGTVGTVTHNRCEKITFHQPSPLFRERLVSGGAVSRLPLVITTPLFTLTTIV